MYPIRYNIAVLFYYAKKCVLSRFSAIKNAKYENCRFKKMRIGKIICDNGKYEYIVCRSNVSFSSNECPVFLNDFDCSVPGIHM